MDWAALAETFVARGTAGARSDVAHAGRARRDPAMSQRRRRDRRRGHRAQRGAAGPGDRCRQPVHRLARPDQPARARRARHRNRRICPALPRPATSCAGSTLASTGSNSFPPEASGGIPALKALAGPFGNVRFCPTGGIRPDNGAGLAGAAIGAVRRRNLVREARRRAGDYRRARARRGGVSGLTPAAGTAAGHRPATPS